MGHHDTRLRRSNPKTGRAAKLVLAAIAALSFAVPIAAEAAGDPVPLPRLRPAYAGSTATAAVVNQPAFAPAQASRYTVEQQRLLYSINNYFNSFRLMEGEFIQFGPSGEQSEGVFFLEKPGRIRFHYRPPTRLDIISDGSTVAIKNTKAQTQDMYSLSQTPLRYLLAQRIDLTSDQIVSGIREEPDLVSLRIDGDGRAQGSITLIFDRRTFELRQWVVTDAQGLNTSIAIFNTATGKRQQSGIYRIDPNAFRR